MDADASATSTVVVGASVVGSAHTQKQDKHARQHHMMGVSENVILSEPCKSVINNRLLVVVPHVHTCACEVVLRLPQSINRACVVDSTSQLACSTSHQTRAISVSAAAAAVVDCAGVNSRVSRKREVVDVRRAVRSCHGWSNAG